MPSKIARRCNAPGCVAFGVFSNGYCGQHRGQSSARQRPCGPLYHSKEWREIFRPRFLGFNPICQRIIDGVRCNMPAFQLHHLNEPHTAAEFFNPHGIVGLCNAHHYPALGTPQWIEGKDFTSTVWTVPSL